MVVSHVDVVGAPREGVARRAVPPTRPAQLVVEDTRRPREGAHQGVEEHEDLPPGPARDGPGVGDVALPDPGGRLTPDTLVDEPDALPHDADPGEVVLNLDPEVAVRPVEAQRASALALHLKLVGHEVRDVASLEGAREIPRSTEAHEAQPLALPHPSEHPRPLHPHRVVEPPAYRLPHPRLPARCGASRRFAVVGSLATVGNMYSTSEGWVELSGPRAAREVRPEALGPMRAPHAGDSAATRPHATPRARPRAAKSPADPSRAPSPTVPPTASPSTRCRSSRGR